MRTKEVGSFILRYCLHESGIRYRVNKWGESHEMESLNNAMMTSHNAPDNEEQFLFAWREVRCRKCG